MNGFICFEDSKQVLPLLWSYHNSWICVRIDFQEIKKRIGGVGVVSTEWLETELTMHEYDCVA